MVLKFLQRNWKTDNGRFSCRISESTGNRSLMKTAVTELLGIEYPIIQGGMAWVGEYHLAAAVSGSRRTGHHRRRQRAGRHCERADPQSAGAHLKAYRGQCHAAQSQCRRSGQGDRGGRRGGGYHRRRKPAKFMEMWKAAGVKVIPLSRQRCHGEADGTRRSGRGGCRRHGKRRTYRISHYHDAGSPGRGCGGHSGNCSRRHRRRQRLLQRHLCWGRRACRWAPASWWPKNPFVHDNYKQKVIKARDIDSEVTGMSTGHPVRQIRNKMTREYLKLEKKALPSKNWNT